MSDPRPPPAPRPFAVPTGIEMEIVNSCEANNGGCSHRCQHSTGGPVCTCNHGYRLDDDLKTCVGKATTGEVFSRRRRRVLLRTWRASGSTGKTL